ncbi:hypothetical protein XENOCAPTIV_012122 [Xenoophorus captivus]|uniref:Proteasome activator complex subunit 4-like HEAT repeat-like domain-containing protein n=1 Tax=Xenoophorus captivus TaxID=1517983 RepID=A0ABV0R2L4_9TELE
MYGVGEGCGAGLAQYGVPCARLIIRVDVFGFSCGIFVSSEEPSDSLSCWEETPSSGYSLMVVRCKCPHVFYSSTRGSDTARHLRPRPSSTKAAITVFVCCNLLFCLIKKLYFLLANLPRMLMFDWQGLFRNYGNIFLPVLQPHLEQLASDPHESAQRCVCEITAGLIRGSKHWSFSKVPQKHAAHKHSENTHRTVSVPTSSPHVAEFVTRVLERLKPLTSEPEIHNHVHEENTQEADERTQAVKLLKTGQIGMQE